jgi:hypothetical protein
VWLAGALSHCAALRDNTLEMSMHKIRIRPPSPVYLGDNVIYFPYWLEDARFVVFAFCGEQFKLSSN